MNKMIQCPYCHKDHVMKNYIDCNLCEHKTEFSVANDGRYIAVCRTITYLNIRYNIIYQIYKKRISIYSDNYNYNNIDIFRIEDKNYFNFTYENDLLLINKYIKNINIK